MNNPYWLLDSNENSYEALNEDLSTEYLIIGGGIAGVTALYLLTEAGLNPVLIDANRIGYGTSGRNTGKATAQHGYVYSRIERNYGIEKAKDYYRINSKAIDFIEEMSRKYNIDCQFKRLPAYLFTTDNEYAEKLKREFEIYQEIGIDSSFEEKIPVDIDVLCAIKMNNQAQFHPKRFIDGLVQQAVKQGGRIFENTRVIDFRPGKECVIKLKNGNMIRAKNVIICSHYPCYDGKGFYFARLKPERSYIIGIEKESFPDAHFINAEDPTISLRYIPEEKILMISGENHKVGHKDGNHYQRLMDYAKKVFNAEEVKYQWSAQDYIPHDYVPYAGYINSDYKNIYIATGFKKWGLTNGISAAMLIKDLILTGDSEYKDLFAQLRVMDILSVNFIKQNADMAVQWIAGKLTLGETELPEEKGTGVIVNINGKRCGYYRDEEDNIFLVDTTCPHMSCELKWNSQEKSWDCPCHGSRFDYRGNVLEGPAEYRLNSYHEPKNKINPQIK
ncbi:MAG: FAD-dependent oxidoreductase [Acetivibrionales bacterium]|jgi:glycine/D-amino acid oxidase-like deaminating enzyme/nitrite reductase/ring-hydroxylating ferredoxin subunit